jgi:methanogenic corrinoid protein MtbC1
MFGASVTPSLAGSHPSGPSAAGPAYDAMESPQYGRRSERLERTIQNEIVPRLLLSHRVGPIPPSLAAAVAQTLTAADVETFVDAIRGADDGRAHAYVRALVANGTPVESVYLDLLAPTAHRLGELWDNDECDFVEVTLAMGRMQGLLRELSQVFLADTGRSETVGNVLLTCVPGEQHTLGVIMVGEFLLRDGWRVLVGAPWTENDLLEMVAAEWYDVIGFSVGCQSRISNLKREIRRLRNASRNPNVQVMVGGKVFNDDPALVARVGADAAASTARQAPHVARSLLASSLEAARPLAQREAIGGHGELREAIRRE